MPSLSRSVAPVYITSTRLFSSTRKHLIKFIGKRSLVIKNSLSTPIAVLSPSSVRPIAKAVKEGNGVYFGSLKGGAMFGRPQLTPAEMAAIEDGGCNNII